jgi:hypothetical protein
MADLKISALPASTTPLAGTEVLPIVQSSSTKQVSVANLTAGRTQTSNGIVQGTAATGYNFTANTPAAGMTSQLLNWYEEGTWTPNQGSGLTVVGVFSSSGRYSKIGRLVTINLSISATTSVSVSNGGVICSNLPFPVLVDGIGGYGSGQNSVTSTLIGVYAYSSSVSYFGSTTTGALYMTISYTATS